MSDDQYCLKWSNHQSTILTNLMEKEQLADCILFTEGRVMKAHQVVISACSPYFEKVLNESRVSPAGMPVLIFSDIKYDELSAMKEYMYRGEVNIRQDSLDSFLKAANSLQIRGLSDKEPCDTNGKAVEAEPSRTRDVGTRRRRRESVGSDTTAAAETLPAKTQRRLESFGAADESFDPSVVVKTEPEDEAERSSVKVEEPQIVQQVPPPPVPQVTTKTEPQDPEVLDLTALDDSDCDDFEMPGPSQSDLSQENDLAEELGGDIFSNDAELVQELLNTRDRILLRRKLSACTADQDRTAHTNSFESYQGPSSSNLVGSSSAVPPLPAYQVDTCLAEPQMTADSSFTSNNIVLKTVLESYMGQVVVNLYKLNGALDSKSSSLLVDECVRVALNLKLHLKVENFSALAQAIHDVFPSEVKEAYYLRPYSLGKSQKYARGKLYDRYRNVRKLLIQSKSIEPLRKRHRSPDTKVPEERTSSQQEGRSEEDDRLIRWLQSNTEPWNDVSLIWVKTFDARRSLIEKWDRFSRAFDTFKILKQPVGHALLDLDFGILHPEAKDKMTTNWNYFRDTLIRAIKINVKDKQCIKLIPIIDSPTMHETNKNVAFLSLLPGLMPPGRMTCDLQSGTVKYSIADSQQSLIVIVKSVDEVKYMLTTVRDAARASGVSHPPFLVVQGGYTEPIEKTYVVIDDIVYAFTDFLTALDICFKSFFALNVKYPRVSEKVWILIQRGLYGLSDNVHCFPSVLQILNRLKLI